MWTMVYITGVIISLLFLYANWGDIQEADKNANKGYIYTIIFDFVIAVLIVIWPISVLIIVVMSLKDMAK